MTPATAIRRALIRLWPLREPEQWPCGHAWTDHSSGFICLRSQAKRHRAARDHDQPDFDPRPDDVLAGRS